MTRWQLTAVLGAWLAAGSLGACGPRIRPLERVQVNGDVLRSRADEDIERARIESAAERARLVDERAATTAAALAGCAPATCAAIARGELRLGMSESQVLAATGTSADAWEIRRSGRVAVMLPRESRHAPSDAAAPIVFVSLEDDAVRRYTYREAEGLRTVASPAGESRAGAAAERAEALRRAGDEFAAIGRLDLALERYDRADVLEPGHAETDLRIAQLLEKQLRPYEAIMRYRIFIHRMELERLRAEGEVAAGIAAAIARAQERIIVLENRR